MSRYTKKPVTIDAIEFTGNNWAEIDKFTPGFRPKKDVTSEIVAEVYDEIHDTWVGVRRGDYIIKGLKGEFYPCDPTVFGESYDAA